VVRASQQQNQASRQVQLPAFIKPAALTALANVLATLPAHAEAGKIFDFNLTGPIMATQFLLLMVFLDKTWFGPVGKVLDERDSQLRKQLGSVRDNSSDVGKLQAEAEKVLREARQAAQEVIAEAKSTTQKEQAKKLQQTKERIDKELETALATLDREKQEALKNLDAQVGKLSGEILARVLPEGVKL
jgi:F-type H+-transporting ATPase subunit b